jgi:hypothetical protein
MFRVSAELVERDDSRMGQSVKRHNTVNPGTSPSNVERGSQR